TYTYTYGGITFTRNIATGLGADDGSGDLGDGETPLGANPIDTTNTSNVVQITHAGHGFATGQVITISGVAAAINGIPADELNGSHVITMTGANTYTFTTTTSANATGAGGGLAGTVIDDSRPF